MRIECMHDEDRAVRIEVHLDKGEVRLTHTPMGVKVEVEGCHALGMPGAPALPRRALHVALPEGMWPEPIRLRDRECIALTDEPTLVVPVQPPAPGMARKERREGDKNDHDKPDEQGNCECRCCRPRLEGGPWEDPGQRFEAFPVPPVVPPDPELYEAEAADRDGAKLTEVRMVGPTPVVVLDLRPVRYTERGQLELLTHVSIEIPYSARPRERASDSELSALLEKVGVRLDPRQLHPLPEPEVNSRAQAERYAELAKSLVINPDDVRISRWTDVFRQLPADYVIITDNQSWNAETIAPVAPLSGDMVSHFERLAAHKRARGVSAKVVTITDIVNGRYGEFRRGARDLQEVLRSFIKHAHKHWGTAWLLLGGDVAVVPTRHAVGAVEGHMDVATTDPPDNNKSFWTGSFLKMHVVSPGTWWPGDAARQLINAATGQLIPYDATAATATNNGLGWYWTASDYTTSSAAPTDFVRVNGPAAVVNARLQWLYEWNRIPTDLYYASLASWVIAWRDISIWLFTVRLPYVYFPPHDWDALDNGLYGQYVGGADVDGVHWATDLSVGRAPVQSGAEAQAFVDKVIAYGNIRYSVFWGQSSWLERVVIAASNWGGGIRVWRSASSPPANNRFHAGANVTVINLGSTPADFGNQLIAEISDTDRRELPYNVNSSPASRGWHFARSATDHSVPVLSISLFGIKFDFPLTSQWIVVHGPSAERDPPTYLFDWVGQDGSMADQEQLRMQLAADLPGWRNVTRLYEDMTDLTPAQVAAGPVGYLTSTRLQTALNGSPHIVSLSGHGSPEGCCSAGVGMANVLANGRPGFIAYADSCLTGALDRDDSFGEALLTNPNGGAVAYVGSTRFSWIGVGDDVQRAFFSALKHTRRIGLLNDSRMGALDFNYWHAYARWIAMSLTLFGDPEMSMWRFPPRVIWPTVRWKLPDRRIPIEVELPRPPRPVETAGKMPDHYWVNVRQADGFDRTEYAAAGTTLSIDVSDARPGKLIVTVHADDPDYAPYERAFDVQGPHWIRGRVVAIVHRENRPWTDVDVLTTAGQLRHWVLEERRATQEEPCCDATLNAVLKAHMSGTDIALEVDRDEDGGRIGGFRLPG